MIQYKVNISSTTTTTDFSNWFCEGANHYWFKINWIQRGNGIIWGSRLSMKKKKKQKKQTITCVIKLDINTVSSYALGAYCKLNPHFMTAMPRSTFKVNFSKIFLKILQANNYSWFQIYRPKYIKKKNTILTIKVHRHPNTQKCKIVEYIFEYFLMVCFKLLTGIISLFKVLRIFQSLLSLF